MLCRQVKDIKREGKTYEKVNSAALSLVNDYKANVSAKTAGSSVRGNYLPAFINRGLSSDEKTRCDTRNRVTPREARRIDRDGTAQSL